MKLRLAVAAASVLAASAARADVDVTVTALIDGRSILQIQNGQASWHHLDGAAPGLWSGNDQPTRLNTYAWFPQWPGYSGEVRCGGCDSSKLDLLTAGIDLGSTPALLKMTVVSARDSAVVKTSPGAANGYLTEIDLNDNPDAGPAFYTVRLTFDTTLNLPGLVSHWKATGDALDATHRNDGALSSGAKYASSEAFLFAPGHFAAPTAGFPIGSGDRTIAGWVYIGEPPSAHGAGENFFFGYGGFGNYLQSYHLGTVGSTLFFSQYGNSILGPALALHTWYHVAATTNDGITTLFVNGDPQGSAALPLGTPPGSQFFMGQIPGDGYRRLTGAVEDVYVFDRALTAAQIQTLMTGAFLPTPQFAPPAPSITSPADGSSLVNGSITVSGIGVPGATVTVFDGAAAIGSTTVGADGSFSVTVSLGVGAHALTATQAANGASGDPSAALHLTALPPAPLFTSGPARSPGNTAAFAGTALPGTVRVYDGGALIALVPSTGAFSFDGLAAPRTLADGAHTLSFTSVVNGFESSPTVFSFVLFTQPPRLVIVAPVAASTQATASQPFALAFAAGYQPPAGVSVAAITVALDGAVVYAGSLAGAPAALDLSLLSPGAHVVSVLATDSLGNASPAPATARFSFAPSLATLRALTDRLLRPLAGACTVSHDGEGDDGDDEDGGRRFTCDDLRTLLSALDRAQQALSGRGGSPDEGDDNPRQQVQRQLWKYITTLQRLQQRGLVPAAAATALLADARFLLAQYGGPPRGDGREH